MKNIFTSYKNPLSVVIVLIIIGGMFAYSKLQTSLFPEITFPKIKVIADAGLQPVDKMMVSVTKPLENAIKQVPDLLNVRSVTSRGSCEISAYISWDSDIDQSLQTIGSKITEIRNSLPPGVQITTEKMNPSILPVIGYTLETNSNNRSSIDMKLLALYTVKPFLSQVQGVADVRVIGGKQKEYWLLLNPQKMGTWGITPEMLTSALNQTNFIQSNGYLTDYRLLYLTVTDASVHSIDDLQNLIIINNGKRIVLLKDIAEVKINPGVEYTKINANGKEGLLVAIVKQPNANLVTLSDQMKAKVQALRKVLPADVSIQPYYMQADFVNDSVKSVTDSLWIGLALAIFVAIIFLRSVKASATILITIPVTICLTMIVIYALGYSLNIMTLGAIAAAIGLIIDDAIVVVEQIHRSHEEHPNELTTTVTQKAIHYLLPAMIGSSLSTIVIFIPFELMSGVAGAYFKVMTNTMIIALVCSYFVTWICLPVIYLVLTRERKIKKFSKKREKAHEVKNQEWVSFFIHKPYISFIIIAALGVAIWLILPLLQTGFLPDMDEGSIVLDYSSPPGTSLQETDRMLREIEKSIIKVPEVQAYSRRTGTQMGFFITEPNRGDYLIQLNKDRSRSTDEVIADIRQQVETTQPALRIDFGQVIGDMLGDLMTSVQPIEIKIYGDDVDKLHKLSSDVATLISDVKGTADVFDGIVNAGPSVNITPDYAKLAQFGLTPAALQTQIQMALEGSTVSNGFLEKEQLSTIRLIYPNSQSQSVASLKDIPIFLPSGRLIPVSSLAHIQINEGDAEIERENLQSIGVVTGRLENRDLGSTMKEIQQKVAAKISLPQGYHIEYGGAFAEQQQSFQELLMILITSSLLVFGVILFLFKDFLLAFVILIIAMLGIAGSYLGLYITNTPLNVGSYTGLIMIVGIIGENSIFTYLQFRESRFEKGVDNAIIYSISTRLRPKLMTALGAIIALMPLALGIGTGAQLHQPLAISVISGFIIALPLLLIVLPSMLRLISKRKMSFDAKKVESV